MTQIKNIKTKYEEQFGIVDHEEDYLEEPGRVVWQFFCQSMIEVLEGLKQDKSNLYDDGDVYESGYNHGLRSTNNKIDQLIAQLREEL